MAVATRMPVEELGAALAIYCKLFKVSPRLARKELDLTQRTHFDEASTWADSNAKVIRLIKEDPRAIAAGSYSLASARGWFSRLIGLGKPRGVSAPADEELENMARDLQAKRPKHDAAKAKRLAELSELVDESFGSV